MQGKSQEEESERKKSGRYYQAAAKCGTLQFNLIVQMEGGYEGDVLLEIISVEGGYEGDVLLEII